MSPPYLASRTAALYAAPFEPYRDGMRIVLLALGIVLLLAGGIPLVTEPSLVFRWDVLTQDGVDGLTKLRAIYVCAAAVLALVFGAVPLATVPRGLLAALVGAAPLGIGLLLVITGSDRFHWQLPVGYVAALTLVPGLLLRQEYRGQLLPRAMTTVGALCTLAMYGIPSEGDPLIQQLVEALSAAPGKQKVLVLVALLPFVLALLSFLCWIPARSSGGAKVLAWLTILAAVVVSYTAMLVAGNLGSMIRGAPNQMLMSPWAGIPGEMGGGLGYEPIAAVWLAFLGYGVATLLGKTLEQSV